MSFSGARDFSSRNAPYVYKYDIYCLDTSSLGVVRHGLVWCEGRAILHHRPWMRITAKPKNAETEKRPKFRPKYFARFFFPFSAVTRKTPKPNFGRKTAEISAEKLVQLRDITQDCSKPGDEKSSKLTTYSTVCNIYSTIKS
jgi:hypothetical protein